MIVVFHAFAGADEFFDFLLMPANATVAEAKRLWKVRKLTSPPPQRGSTYSEAITDFLLL